MVKPPLPHSVLVKCNVLFLGHAPPTPNQSGMKALTEPLRKAYPAHATNEVEGINSWLTIYTSGIQLQLVDSHNPPVFWFPIQNLYIAAANKCVNHVNAATGVIQDSRFVGLEKQEAEESSHAPLFSIISRTSQSSSMECYTFMTKNDESALALVEAAENAYRDKGGHTTERIPSEVGKDIRASLFGYSPLRQKS